MLSCFVSSTVKDAIPIFIVTEKEYANWLAKQPLFVKKWLQSTGFTGDAGQLNLIPSNTGKMNRVIYCLSDKKYFWNIGSLPFVLPEGNYSLQVKQDYLQNYSMAWGLGAYQFSRYKKPARSPAKLVLEKSILRSVENIVQSIYLVRDLINTPTEDMGPSEFSKVAINFSKQLNVKLKQVIGNNLLKENYPCIHTVGRASDDAPRLIDLRWGNKKHPKVTLVGKGVCFDTGGLDIKPASGMLLMKKDMGGAAHVLGLARMIIQAKLAINLRVLIPVVENYISGNAYRPGDVIRSRKGITIEIGNTDAEGRVILADALTEAVSENPDLLIDISTLTGAARVAVGTDLSALFTNQDSLAQAMYTHANQEQDYIWRLPLFALYRDALNSNIADINNNTSDGYAGAITAALFLKEFVPDHIPWMHFDLMAWNLKTRPGRPQGGEAMALRALFSFLKERY
jgi:leucyl aminopeptidase